METWTGRERERGESKSVCEREGGRVGGRVRYRKKIGDRQTETERERDRHRQTRQRDKERQREL